MGNLYYESLENDSSNNKFTNHVIISLKDFMDMNGEIERLKYECDNLRSKYENLKEFMKDTNLPLDVISEGKYENMRLETQTNPIDMSVTYVLFATVQDIDLYRHERARLYNENEE